MIIFSQISEGGEILQMKVGIIGIGTMGSKMAEGLIKAGYTVFANDVNGKAEKKSKRTRG